MREAAADAPFAPALAFAFGDPEAFFIAAFFFGRADPEGFLMTLRRPFMTFFGAMTLAMQIGGAGLEAPPPLLRRNGEAGRENVAERSLRKMISVNKHCKCKYTHVSTHIYVVSM